jgi:hypothetical protein
MEVRVTESTTQDIWFDDSVALGRSDLTYCGTRSYSLSTNHSFLIIIGTTLTLSTNLVADAGTYNNLSISVGLVDYPTVT